MAAKKVKTPGFWQEQPKQPEWKSWASYAFEAICYKHIDEIRTGLKISPGSLVATWRFVPTAKSEYEGAQVDLLFDSLDDTITICEIKYACDEYAIDKSYAHKLLKKMDVFRKKSRTKKQLFLAMVTTFGLKQTMYSEEIVTNQVILDDLFK